MAKIKTMTASSNKHQAAADSTADKAKQAMAAEHKCSAVSCLERDMPDHDISEQVRQFREVILREHAEHPGEWSERDMEMFRSDDWWSARFLLRQKLDMDKALDMARKTMKYNQEFYYWIPNEEIPREFYQTGGMFQYEPDRLGNIPVYAIVRRHRKLPEVQNLVNGYIYRTIKQADERAKGRGVVLVIDNTDAGLASADLDSLFYIISMLINYFPRGLSYILVHNLPWYFKPFWQIAKQVIPSEYLQLIKFSNDKTIFEYFDAQNLPPVMGGTCDKPSCQSPPEAPTLVQVAKFWGVDKELLTSVYERCKMVLPAEAAEEVRRYVYDDEPKLSEDCAEAGNKYWDRVCPGKPRPAPPN